ncbi:MAG: Ig-like domain-containing protein [Edaphobacter sp.]
MRLVKMLPSLLGAVLTSHLSVAFAAGGAVAAAGVTGTDAPQAFTAGTGNAGQGSTTPQKLLIKAAPSGGSSAISGMKTLTLNMPSDTKTETLKIVLNGKDVTSRFSTTSCAAAICETGTLSSADGLRAGKNVLSAVAKSEGGRAVSSRLRFSGDDTQTPNQSFTAMVRPGAQNPSAQALPTASSFLPPTVAFNTISGTGADATWFQLGTLIQHGIASNCTEIYGVVVLDRQTLVEKTAAPESSPQCISNGGALKAYLSTLTSDDLVIVGTTSNLPSDAATGVGALDTSAIGGTVYFCPPAACSITHPNQKLSLTAPAGYLAIGVGGASSSPGQAYENYYLANETGVLVPYAYGMLSEDAYGNYNFQSSTALEYTVSPGGQSGSAYISLVSPPSYPNQTVTMTPPPGVADGFWLMILDRADPTLSFASCASSSGTQFSNCGTFYPIGADDPTTRKAAMQALAGVLQSVNRRQLVFLTTIGHAAYGSVWQAANNDANSSLAGGWTDLGFQSLMSAFRTLGLPDTTFLSLGNPDSSLTYITSLGLGNSLSGQSILSTTVYSQQGQSGYVHGVLTHDLQGLFRPGRTQQASPSQDYVNFTMAKVALQEPIEWPELSSTLLPNADSAAGQLAAYQYLSWYLLNAWYIPGQSGTQGISGPYAYDIHYFFTGSLNGYLNIHAFDPANAVWPGTPGFKNGSPFNISCSVTGATSCTWTNPFDNTNLVFTQNDFMAVQTQLHNEIVDLTNVLLFMVNGSTNMKDVVAAGNSNAALALLQAASAVGASLNQPQAIPATNVTVGVSNIIDMVGGVLSTAAQVVGFNAELQTVQSAIDLTADIINDAGGIAGGFSSGGSAASAPIPSPDYTLNTTIAQLANTDLQGQMMAGFDTTLDSITSDWGRLNAIGPQITNPSNSSFFFPNQVLQLLSVNSMNQAAQRSIYLSVIPAFYQVQYWPMVNSDSLTSANFPDMGYTSSGNYNSCTAFYPSYNAPPAYTSAWYPTAGGTLYTPYWDIQDNQPQETYPFEYDWANNPIDYYVLAAPLTNTGQSDSYSGYPSPQLTSILFAKQPGGANFPFDAFVAHNGPMDSLLTGGASTFFDGSAPASSIGTYPFTNVANFTGHYLSNICSMASLNGSGLSSAPPSQLTTLTTLIAPDSAILGEGVPLQATVVPASGSGSVPTGAVEFCDGTTVLGTVTLDSTGKASFTATGLAIGVHALAAYYGTSANYEASNSAVSALRVYANAPDISLTLSASSLQVSYGSSSGPVTVQATSHAGMEGTVTFTCTGLPVGMTCTFSPAQATLAVGSNMSTTLTIKSTSTANSAGTMWDGGIGVFLAPLSLLCLWRTRNGGQRLQGLLSLLLLSAVSICCVMGCSGSSNSQTNQETGSKTILIAASNGSITRTIPLVLNIQ